MKERKNRHTIWLTDSAWDAVETHYQKDNCSTKNEYIEKAVRFYAGYQDAEQAAGLQQILQARRLIIERFCCSVWVKNRSI